MTVIHAAKDLSAKGRKVCLAIGFFDGVHLGHQQIIRQTITDARQNEAIALVLTFDRHPNSVVAPVRLPPLIYSLPQKLRTIGSLGADALLLLHFDEPLSRQSGEAFIRSLVRDLGQVQSLCVGANFVFGYKRGGNVELLKRLGEELRFAVHGMAAVALDGKPVSSTRIRQTIAAGDLDAASQMLGRAYSLAGLVVRGDELGRQLGFPTANIDVTGLALPPRGVYAVLASARRMSRPSRGRSTLNATSESEMSALLPDERPNGKTWRAVLNIGYRPTLQNPNPQLRVEAHLIDFEGDLYGQELEVAFVKKLRDERKFASVIELRDQIARDILDAQSRFSG